jgi:hypothetical protein
LRHLHWPLDYTHLPRLESLTQRFLEMEAEGEILRGSENWWITMKDFARDKRNYSDWRQFATESEFPQFLSDFLFSSAGTGSKPNFKLVGPLECGAPAPAVLAAKLRVLYLPFEGPKQHIPARRAIDQLVTEQLGPEAFSFNKIYAAWETDEIIGFELWRNVGLAMACCKLNQLTRLVNSALEGVEVLQQLHHLPWAHGHRQLLLPRPQLRQLNGHR